MSYYDSLSQESRNLLTNAYRRKILNHTRNLHYRYSAAEIFTAIKRRDPKCLLSDVCVALIEMHKNGELVHERMTVGGCTVSVFYQHYSNFLFSSEIERRRAGGAA